jgi:hypothetical protein
MSDILSIALRELGFEGCGEALGITSLDAGHEQIPFISEMPEERHLIFHSLVRKWSNNLNLG